MTWLLFIYLNGGTVQINQPYKTEAQCRYAGAKLEAEQRTQSNYKELIWDCQPGK